MPHHRPSLPSPVASHASLTSRLGVSPPLPSHPIRKTSFPWTVHPTAYPPETRGMRTCHPSSASSPITWKVPGEPIPPSHCLEKLGFAPPIYAPATDECSFTMPSTDVPPAPVEKAANARWLACPIPRRSFGSSTTAALPPSPAKAMPIPRFTATVRSSSSWMAMCNGSPTRPTGIWSETSPGAIPLDYDGYENNPRNGSWAGRVPSRGDGDAACPVRRVRGPGLRACVILMRLTDERSSTTLTWRRVAEGNCVAARRGGEQPEANLPSQTRLPRRVNPIRPEHVASLRRNGEAWSSDLTSGTCKHVKVPGYVSGVWGEKVGKARQLSIEILPCARPRREEVRALIVALRRVTTAERRGAGR